MVEDIRKSPGAMHKYDDGRFPLLLSTEWLSNKPEEP